MAYSAERFSENAAGMTGSPTLASYDGSGTDAEGGDTLSDIRAPGFFAKATAPEVWGAIRAASHGRSVGEGLPIIIHGNNGMAVDLFYEFDETSGSPPVRTNEIRRRGGTFAIT